MNFDITSLFTEGKKGKLSAIRVGFLFTLLIVMLNWSYVTYKKADFVPLPENAVTLIIGLASAKVVQRFGEKNPSEVSKEVDSNPKV
jgi:hypothetical protein